MLVLARTGRDTFDELVTYPPGRLHLDLLKELGDSAMTLQLILLDSQISRLVELSSANAQAKLSETLYDSLSNSYPTLTKA